MHGRAKSLAVKRGGDSHISPPPLPPSRSTASPNPRKNLSPPLASERKLAPVPVLRKDIAQRVARCGPEAVAASSLLRERRNAAAEVASAPARLPRVTRPSLAAWRRTCANTRERKAEKADQRWIVRSVHRGSGEAGRNPPRAGRLDLSETRGDYPVCTFLSRAGGRGDRKIPGVPAALNPGSHRARECGPLYAAELPTRKTMAAMKVEATASPGNRPAYPTFAEAARVWLKIALLSFGGPAAQIALMHRVLVEEKRCSDGSSTR